MFVWPKTVEWAETDMAGVVHFCEYFRYMESAEHAFFRSLGLSVMMEHGGEALTWPRVSCSFEFRAPLRFEEAFAVELRVEAVSSKSLTFRADIVRDGRCVAHGASTSVCCRLDEGGEMKAAAIPAAVRARLCAARDEAR